MKPKPLEEMKGNNNKTKKNPFRERPTEPPFTWDKAEDEEADASSYDGDYDTANNKTDEEDTEEQRDQPLVDSDISVVGPLPTFRPVSWSAPGPPIASYGSFDKSARHYRHHSTNSWYASMPTTTLPHLPGVARAQSERSVVRHPAGTNQPQHHHHHRDHKLPQRYLHRYSSEPNVYVNFNNGQFLPPEEKNVMTTPTEPLPSYQLSPPHKNPRIALARSLPPSPFTRDDTYIPVSPSRQVRTNRAITRSLLDASMSLPSDPSPMMYARSSNLTASLRSIPERHHLKSPFDASKLRTGDDDEYQDPTGPLLPPRPLGSGSYSSPGSFFTSSSTISTASTGKVHHARRHASSTRNVDQFMKDYVGTEQPKHCHGVVCASVFLLQVALVIGIGIAHGVSMILAQRRHEVPDPVNYLNIVGVTCLSGVFASVLSGLVLFTMTIVYKRLIQIALVLAVSLSFLWGILGVVVLPGSYVPATGFIACMLCTGYTAVVWVHIPFASANLHAALTAVRSTPSIWVVAFLFQIGALVWTIGWTFTVVSVCYYTENFGKVVNIAALGLMVLSYFWTFQVIVHVVQVTVARVIARWWENPDDDSSSAIFPFPQPMQESLSNAMVYSFGSICLGGLLVAPVQLFRQAIKQCRQKPQNEDDTFFDLPRRAMEQVTSPMATCVDKFSANFNHWAFIYVGVYRYPFIEAANKASELLHARGWTAVVDDDLIMNVLLLTSVVIGGCTGCFEMFVEMLDGNAFAASFETSAMAFSIGLVVGIVLSCVVMGVVLSSVNTIILCYACRPMCFSSTHPELSEELSQVWTGCVA